MQEGPKETQNNDKKQLKWQQKDANQHKEAKNDNIATQNNCKETKKQHKEAKSAAEKHKTTNGTQRQQMKNLHKKTKWLQVTENSCKEKQNDHRDKI